MNVGDELLVGYDVPGAPLLHRRLVVRVSQLEPLHAAVVSPDLDLFMEHFTDDNADIAVWYRCGHGGVPPAGLGGVALYDFQGPLTAQEFINLVPRADGLVHGHDVRLAAAGGPPPLGAPGPAGPFGPPAAGFGGAAAAGGGVPVLGVGAGAAGGLAALLGGPAAAPGGALFPPAGAGALAPAGAALAAPPPAAAPAAAAGAAAAAGPAGHAGLAAALAGPAALGPGGAAAGAAPGPAGAGAPIGAVDDCRTLAVSYDVNGKRHRSFSAGVALLSPLAWGDWPIPGPRTVHWVATFMLENGGSALGHHVQWRSNIRRGVDDITVSNHLEYSKVFETALCYDQLEISNLATLELVARQLQVCEEKHRDLLFGTKRGDSDDHDEYYYFTGMASTRGLMVAPALSTWISEQVCRENAVAKERRKAREERSLAKPKKGAKGGQE